MDVRSASSSGLSGFQDASVQLNNASSRIAQSGSAEKSKNVDQLPVEASSSQEPRTPVSLTTELVNLKVAEFQAKASVNVIRTADEMLGTLIDTSA
ncbi:hypothetical protein PCNPT3_11415 [Psychromonas sp. CNPT3]|uniref:hypothetical protein n=1 Tax=Psychromonas sp. CNPT3 TaxID=314282 RepID=UPI00006E38EF|nr:hypothetical protein [Psychromonas sp. CNPT3]AGH82219.1 hypothetical protein PCNPT3_11415 [Psychromonas sp. CNPT3]